MQKKGWYNSHLQRLFAIATEGTEREGNLDK